MTIGGTCGRFAVEDKNTSRIVYPFERDGMRVEMGGIGKDAGRWQVRYG